MYMLKTEKEFDAAHFLAGYQGKCRNIHGHRWRVSVEISSETLQDTPQQKGMVVDFSDLKHDLGELTDYFDHTLIYEAGTLKPKTEEALMEENFALRKVDFRPTAENFAGYFFGRLKKKGYTVDSVAVYETPNNCAVYRE